MNKLSRALYSAALTVLLTSGLVAAAPDAARSAAATSLVVTTDKGAVSGVVARGVENFLDIPYAAPPVGKLRFAPPRPPARWAGIRNGRKYGSLCSQPKSLDAPDGPILDEDCLTINVQRPIGASSSEKLPVYVYIHGGGFVTGSGVKDGQDKIVRMNHVVGVSLNYRLGALGFAALPALANGREAGDYGSLDQLAALRWVHRNIAAFGGDASRVTIGGESAGGWSVCTHLASPESRGLFSRAIMQSGSCSSHSVVQAEAAGVKFAAKVGCTDSATMATCLRAKPVATLLKAQDQYYVPTSGTPFLPIAPYTAIGSGRFAHVPVLIGSMRDEGRSFMQGSIGWSKAKYTAFVESTFGKNAGAVLANYPLPSAADPAAPAYQSGAILTDDGTLASDFFEQGIGGCANAALTNLLARYVPVEAYEISYRTGPGWYSIPGYIWGAGHATELPYLYPQHDGGRTYAAFTPPEHQLADRLVQYWGDFITKASISESDRGTYNRDHTLVSFGAGDNTVVIPAKAFALEHKCGFWDTFAGKSVSVK